MKITVLEQSKTEKITVRSAYNTFVEAFDWYLGEYRVIPLAQAVMTASGEYDVRSK